MIDDMTVRNFAPNTMLCYLKQVTYFAQHFGRSSDRLGPEEIRSYQIYLAKERKVGISSRTVAVSALRFLTKDNVRKQCAAARKTDERDMNAQDCTLQSVTGARFPIARTFCGPQGLGHTAKG